MAYKGERHAWLQTPSGKIVRANYCGPGTQLEKRLRDGSKPKTNFDAICQKHDMAYANATTRGDIRGADIAMLSAMEDDWSIPPLERNVIGFMMKTKMFGEDIGMFGPETFTEMPGLHPENRSVSALDVFEYENMGSKACNKRSNIACALDNYG